MILMRLPILSIAPTIATSIESTSSISTALTIKIAKKIKLSKKSEPDKPTKLPEFQPIKPLKKALRSNKRPKPSKSCPPINFILFTLIPSIAPIDYIEIEHSASKLATVMLPLVVVTGSAFFVLILLSFRFQRRCKLTLKASIENNKNNKNLINNAIIQTNDKPDNISMLDGGVGKTVCMCDLDKESIEPSLFSMDYDYASVCNKDQQSISAARATSLEPSLFSMDYNHTSVYNKDQQSLCAARVTGLITHKQMHDDVAPCRKDLSFTEHKVPSTNVITIEAPSGKLGILLTND